MDKDMNENYVSFAKAIRKLIIDSSQQIGKNAIHFGPALSVADFLGVLYGGYMKCDANNPLDDERDRFILSKGHAYTALYAALCLKGYFTKEEFFANFMRDNGFLPAHPILNIQKGIECSSGSLGMSLSFAVGKAFAAKTKCENYTTYVVIGDGECNEGSVWEAFMLAAQLNLYNLVVFVDCNGLQHDDLTKDVIDIKIGKMLESIGWQTVEIDGNNIPQIVNALDSRKDNTQKPFAVIGRTIKGKGISFMENDNSWHHATLKESLYKQAMEELL